MEIIIKTIEKLGEWITTTPIGAGLPIMIGAFILGIIIGLIKVKLGCGYGPTTRCRRNTYIYTDIEELGYNRNSYYNRMNQLEKERNMNDYLNNNNQ